MYSPCTWQINTANQKQKLCFCVICLVVIYQWHYATISIQYKRKIRCNNSHMACFVWVEVVSDKICLTDRMPRQVYGLAEIPFHLSLLLFLLYHLDFTVLTLSVTVTDRAGVLRSSHTSCQRSQIDTDSTVSYYSVISVCVCVRV